MKKFMLIFMCLVLVLIMQGCKKKKELEEARKGSPNMDTTTQEVKDFASVIKEPSNLDESLLSRKALSDDELSQEIIKIYQDVHFDYDRSEIKASDIEILNAIASHMESHPEINLQIEGHCDERASQEYNMALGERRATSVYKFLSSYGIAKERLQTISYGEEKPLDASGTEEAHSKNRRAHFNIMR